MVLILSTRTCAQDSVLAVDCRDFSDPQRHKDKEERRRRGEENHIGYHHTVFAGLLRGGALVYNQRTRLGTNRMVGALLSAAILEQGAEFH